MATSPDVIELTRTQRDVLEAFASPKILAPITTRALLESHPELNLSSQVIGRSCERLMRDGLLSRQNDPRHSGRKDPGYVWMITQSGLDYLRSLGVEVRPRPIPRKAIGDVYPDRGVASSDAALRSFDRLVAPPSSSRSSDSRPQVQNLPPQVQPPIVIFGDAQMVQFVEMLLRRVQPEDYNLLKHRVSDLEIQLADRDQTIVALQEELAAASQLLNENSEIIEQVRKLKLTIK